MSEQEEIEATLAEHRAWTWNRFKEQHGAHIIAENVNTGETHVFRLDAEGRPAPLCGVDDPTWMYRTAISVWPTCEKCAETIYSLCSTSLPETVSVESEVSDGQLVLPGAENW